MPCLPYVSVPLYSKPLKRKNMKDKLDVSAYEKQLLNQHGIIETVIGHLKHGYHV